MGVALAIMFFLCIAAAILAGACAAVGFEDEDETAED